VTARPKGGRGDAQRGTNTVSARLRRGLTTLGVTAGIVVTAALVLAIWVLLARDPDPIPDRSLPAWALRPGSFGELTSPTAMREGPSLGLRPWETIDAPILALVVDAQPAGADVWYRLEYRWRRLEPVFAWAHASSSQPLLEPFEPKCPKPPLTLPAIGGMTPAERLVCFGKHPLEIPGTLSDRLGGPAPAFVGDPPWLASDPLLFLRGDGDGVLPIHLPPDLQIDRLGEPVVVTGHFDDRRSLDCHRQAIDQSWPNETEDEQVLSCRQRFVVTGLRSP
jgi:hypothetical protein